MSLFAFDFACVYILYVHEWDQVYMYVKESGAIDSIQKCCNLLLRESEDCVSKSSLKEKKNMLKLKK